MRKLFVSFLLCCAVPGMTGPALGQENVNSLDTVVVTADRMAEPVREVSRSVTVIAGDDIEKSAAGSLVEVLKHYGVQTFWDGSANYGNEGVVMRGGQSSMHGFDLAGDILVLVDGRRVGSDNFSLISMNNVERIEVIRGPGAVQYGSSAIGGVINVITRRGGEKPEISLEAGGGSFAARQGKAFVSGRAGKLDLAAWGSFAGSGDIRDGDGHTVENSARDRLLKYGFNLGWNFSGRHRLGLSLNGMDGRKMEMGPYSSTTYANQYQNRDYYLLDLLYEGASEAGNFSWLARGYAGRTAYNLNRESRRAANRGQRADYSDNSNRIYGGQAQLTYAGSERFQLTGGVDVLYYDMEANQPYSIHTPVVATAVRANYTSSDYLDVGVFLFGKLYLLEKDNLVLSAGVRHDRFRVNTRTSYDPAGNRARIIDVSSNLGSFTSSLGAAYSPWDFLKLRANFSQAFRMPPPRQLGGLYAMAGSTLFVGNPDLKPEKSQTWEAGFDISHKALNLGFTWFNTRYRDMITALPADSNSERLWVNLSEAHISGLEGSASFDLGQRFNWPIRLAPYVSLTHLTTFRDGDRNPLTDLAADSVSWGLDFAWPRYGTRASLDFTYYGRVRTSATSGGVTTYSYYVPGGSTIADFNLSQRIWEFSGKGELEVKFSVTNLFDKQYATQGDAVPGRGFYLGLAYTF